MDKWDAIENKVTEKKGSSKWVVILCVVAGVVFACGGLIGVFVFVDVDGYLHDTKHIVQLYDFYDLKIGKQETAVYIFGDSFVSFSIYSPLVNQQLKDQGYNITEYNLCVDNSLPVMTSLQTNNIIESKPSLIIIGVSYRHLADVDMSWVDERVFLVRDRINLSPDSLEIYTKEQLEDVYSYDTLMYKKRFLKSALEYKKQTSGIPSSGDKIYNYYIDPNYPRGSMQHGLDEIIAAANDPNNSFRAKITDEPTQNKEALLYMIKKFEEHNIPVVLISNPLNPILYEQISDESRQNFHTFLNSTGVKWYDMEKSMDSKYFVDIYHLSGEGQLIFTPYVTQMIVEEFS